MRNIHPAEALTLAEAAKKTRLAEEDILRQAALGKIRIYLWFGAQILTKTGMVSGWLCMLPDDCLRLIRYEKAHVWEVINQDGIKVSLVQSLLNGGAFTVNGHLLAKYELQGQTKWPPCPPDGPWQADEIRTAYLRTKRKDLYIHPDDLGQLLPPRPVAAPSMAAPQETASSKQTTEDEPASGRGTAPFYDAVRRLFAHLHDKDKNHPLTRTYARQKFADELLRWADDEKNGPENPELSQYIALRIEPSLTKHKIRTKEYIDDEGKTHTSKPYDLDTLSRVLSACRKNPPSLSDFS